MGAKKIAKTKQHKQILISTFSFVGCQGCGRGGLSGQGGGERPSTSSIPSTKSTFPELAANAALVLLAVACSLLDRQLAAQAETFENEGGFTERLYRVRSEKRKGSSSR